jgi:aminoglycoside phosphotransferase (APT) family kinase protein
MQPDMTLPETVLADYLSQHIDGFAGPIRTQKFSGGQSNPTYLIESTSGGHEAKYVLRRKPPGVLLASAHAVDREFRVLSALVGTDVPAARPLHLCMDDSVIGSAFYVMEFIEGRVFWDPALPEIASHARGDYYAEIARVLGAIHRLQPAQIGLGDFGKPGDYFARQLRRWQEQYRQSVLEPIPEMDALIAQLQARLPSASAASAPAALVHGDFRIDNLMFHPTQAKVIAVMDWELSTLGDPLADASYFSMALRLPANPTLPGLAGKDRAALGIPSESAWLARYLAASGNSAPADWPFCLAFNFFRLAAIAQGVKWRAAQGNASNARAQDIGQMVQLLATQGLAALN